MKQNYNAGNDALSPNRIELKYMHLVRVRSQGDRYV